MILQYITIEMEFNHYQMFANFWYCINFFDLYCTLTKEVCPKLNMHFDSRSLELLKAWILTLVYILLNIRNGIEL